MVKASTIIISILIVILLLGGVIAFLNVSALQIPVNPLEVESDDGNFILRITYYDADGNIIPAGIAQSIDVINFFSIFYISAAIDGQYNSATPAPQADAINLRPSGTTTTPAGYLIAWENQDPTFATSFSKTTLLTTDTALVELGRTDETCAVAGTHTDCDSNIIDGDIEECVNVGGVNRCLLKTSVFETAPPGSATNFITRVLWTFITAEGNPSPVDPGAPGDLTFALTLSSDFCDGTPLGVADTAVCDIDSPDFNCCADTTSQSETVRPFMCILDPGTSLSYVTKSSVCGCPDGFTVSGDTCVLNTCGSVGSLTCITELNYGDTPSPNLICSGTNPTACGNVLAGGDIGPCYADLNNFCNAAGILTLDTKGPNGIDDGGFPNVDDCQCPVDCYGNSYIYNGATDSCDPPIYDALITTVLQPGTPQSITNVNFRTDNRAYGTGNNVAFNAACGTTLTGFGPNAGSSSSGANTCAQDPTLSGGILQLTNLPGDAVTGGGIIDTWQLWTVGADIFMCQDRTANGHTKRLFPFDASPAVDTTPTQITGDIITAGSANINLCI